MHNGYKDRQTHMGSAGRPEEDHNGGKQVHGMQTESGHLYSWLSGVQRQDGQYQTIRQGIWQKAQRDHHYRW